MRLSLSNGSSITAMVRTFDTLVKQQEEGGSRVMIMYMMVGQFVHQSVFRSSHKETQTVVDWFNTME